MDWNCFIECLDKFCDKYYEHLKTLVIMFISAIISVLSPVKGALIFLFVSFAINMVVGVSAALNTKDEEFSIKKFVSAFKEAFLYAFAIIILFWAGDNFKDTNLSVTGVKWVTYIAIWGYWLNIFKNANIMFPNSKAIELIYLLLSTKMFWKIKEFVGLKKSKDEN